MLHMRNSSGLLWMEKNRKGFLAKFYPTNLYSPRDYLNRLFGTRYRKLGPEKTYRTKKRVREDGNELPEINENAGKAQIRERLAGEAMLQGEEEQELSPLAECCA